MFVKGYGWFYTRSPGFTSRKGLEMTASQETKTEQLVASLRRRIETGDFAVGHRLPSEREIGEEFGVSRITVRAALQWLQAENVIHIVPHTGAFVGAGGAMVTIGLSKPIAGPDEPLFPRPDAKTRAQAHSGKILFERELTPAEKVSVGKELGARIGIRPGIEMVHCFLLRLLDGTPYALVESYQVTHVYTSSEEDRSTPYERKQDILHGRVPSSEEAALLQIARNQGVIEQETWTWDASGAFREYRRAVTNGALHAFGYCYDVAADGTILSLLLPESMVEMS
jgi:DNA-binding GntR family transcriptional regulator